MQDQAWIVGYREVIQVGPIWMTFRQASELNAHVRKGEKGSLVVFANAITRTERDDKTGEDVEREIPYMKGYTVFNVEQIEGLPEIYLRESTNRRLIPCPYRARGQILRSHERHHQARR